MSSSKQSLLRKIPSVDALLQDRELERYIKETPRKIVVDSVRASLAEIRRALAADPTDDVDEDAIRRRVLAGTKSRVEYATHSHYGKVINATGIILHTALGRAVLPKQAVRAIEKGLSGYSLVQADIETGRRSGRDAKIEWLLQQLTGAEAATVVNNNAAATSIVLNTVADGKEVIVSRGQLVEIGGAFRLPEVMAASGAKLVEVGTTNKTHPRDYENAITENTAVIMRVHPSNYKISGFTSEVALEKLVEIAHAHNLIVFDDVGAGPLVDFSQFGFEPEPTLPESVRTGADLITCSADKLIGACQGGIILGKADLIRRVRKNPFARIVRVGKLTFAALEATLTLFLDQKLALQEVPTLRMLRLRVSDLVEQAERIARAVREQIGDATVRTVDGHSQMGSGSLPTQNLPTRLVEISSKTMKPDEIAVRLRRNAPPVFARIRKNRVLVDPRTLLDGEQEAVIKALVEALKPEETVNDE
jgi:L-seryl-tRNA(Ser) seleniumtransferase